MKRIFLPNYFKKIGLACFFTAAAVLFIVSMYVSFTLYTPSDAALLGQFDSAAYNVGYALGSFFRSSIDGANDHLWLFRLCSALLVLGITLYMLAKEKIEDEYIDAIRWASIRLSTIISIGVALFYVLIGHVLPARTFLLILFFSYLISLKVRLSKPVKDQTSQTI